MRRKRRVLKFRLIFFFRLIKFPPSSSSRSRPFVGLFFNLDCRFDICLVWSCPFVGLFFLPWLSIRHLSCLISSVRWSLFFLPWLRIRYSSCLISSVHWSLFFLTLVADSTFVLFDLVRRLVSLSFTTGKFWGYGQYTKIWSALKKNFCHIARILRPYPNLHESNSVHAYIAGRQYIIVFFWAAQKYLVAAQTHFWCPIIYACGFHP